MIPLVPTPHRLSSDGARLRLGPHATISPGAGPLLAELRAATGLPLPERVRGADLELTADPAIAPQSYVLEIADRVRVRSADPAGAFYGLQTVLKLLSGRELPKVTITDGPAVAVRGVMLDLGRRHWDPAYLRRFVRRMAWLGYNRLQLHLTEWNGFRVRLPGYEDLATEPAYSLDDLTELIGYARSLHIEAVPEIDLPAHASHLIARRPELRPADAALNDGAHWTGHTTDAWTMDITRPANREWIKGLLAAFCAAFDTPAIHIGADEWPVEPALSAAPALVAYARSIHPDHGPSDALIAFVNELAQVVRDHGKRPEMWNWWEYASGGTHRISPARDIRLTAWPDTEAEVRAFSDAGYDVIAAPAVSHYVTPRTTPGNRTGVNYVTADPRHLYHDWTPSQVTGYQLCVWADWAEEQPDAYFDWYATRPLDVLADRLWGGPLLADVDDYLTVVDALPYTGKAPLRLVREVGPSGEVQPVSGLRPVGEVGSVCEVGLAGGVGAVVALAVPVRIRRVRFRPAVPSGARAVGGKWPEPVWQALDAVRGTRFQGALTADGPWEDLAVIEWLPTTTWNVLDVEADGAYTCLRAVDAPDGLEIEWWSE
ncbi:family 20 glycosylhydrolase [Nonomuraea endophytica]|uniref:family 20 glycosylhydrolase n=1 Tax=Nonomuraea endophytica TaxID=714136 RepID=UPI0037C5258D